MLAPTTLEIIRSALRADPNATPADRKRHLNYLRYGTVVEKPSPTQTPTPRIIRRDEAARLLSSSLRLVDRLAQEGTLKKVTLPGRKRAAGFLEADIRALMQLPQQKQGEA